jgi:hypothetical protein
MKKYTTLMMLSVTIIGLSCNNLIAQDTTRTEKSQLQHGQHFIDKNGDGYNDNAPDHDGDGIPNGLDPDWQNLKAEKGKKIRWRFIDLDGDGINDNVQNDADLQKSQDKMLNNQKNESSMNGQAKDNADKSKKRKRGKN